MSISIGTHFFLNMMVLVAKKRISCETYSKGQIIKVSPILMVKPQDLVSILVSLRCKIAVIFVSISLIL